MKVNKDVLCKYFSFLAYQRSILYETLDTLIDALTALSGILSFVGRETDKSKVEAPKQHHENDILAGKLI